MLFKNSKRNDYYCMEKKKSLLNERKTQGSCICTKNNAFFVYIYSNFIAKSYTKGSNAYAHFLNHTVVILRTTIRHSHYIIFFGRTQIFILY
jgi:hypothetical protein